MSAEENGTTTASPRTITTSTTTIPPSSIPLHESDPATDLKFLSEPGPTVSTLPPRAHKSAYPAQANDHRNPSTTAMTQVGIDSVNVPNAHGEVLRQVASTNELEAAPAPPRSPALSTNSFASAEGTAVQEDMISHKFDQDHLRARKISFGNLLEVGASDVGVGHPTRHHTAESQPAPRKLSGPQKLIRRAKSFTTSPILGSTSTFGRQEHADKTKGPRDPSPSLAPSSRSSVEIADAAMHTLSPPAASPGSSSTSPTSPFFPPPKDSGSNGKGKAKDFSVAGDTTAGPSRNRKSTLMLRRSTFSIFRRNDSSSKASNPSPSPSLVDSPASSPTTTAFVPAQASGATLPSLPSLQFSSAPYRMSWQYGAGPANGSPSTPSIVLPSAEGTPPRNGAPPFRRTSSAGSPVLRRNGSWAGSIPAHVSQNERPWSESSPLQDASPVVPARRILTRAGRSNSDGISRFSLIGASSSSSDLTDPWQQRQARSRSGSTSNSTVSAITPPLSTYRPASPLKMISASAPVASHAGGGVAVSSTKRPLTAGSLTSIEGRGGVFGAVAGFFGSSSSVNMSRSSSQNSAAVDTHSQSGANEFGALFGAASPVKSRRRGLSVGDRIFGPTDSRLRANSSSGLANSWVQPSPGGLLVPSPSDASTPTPTATFSRTRASTDPRRSSSSSHPSQSSYFPPFLGSEMGDYQTASSSFSHHTGLPSPPESSDAVQNSSVSLSRPSTSPPPSRKSSFSVQAPGRSRATSIKVDVAEGETPEHFVSRLSSMLNKGDVARVLSSSAEPFFAGALELYFTNFEFLGDPLDIALRKFLMESTLPTETQQIDRVVEAFAKRYSDCNPGLYTSTDTPYVLAFSLIMLSTDHFNPSNKNKMTKGDYLRNTRLDDVAPEVLEYFFDQITLTPFSYVDDGNEFGASRPDLQASTGSFFSKSTNSGKDRAKFDPYQLIASANTHSLRIDVESIIPSRSPFSFTGTTSFLNATALHQLFAQAPVLQITAPVNRPRSKSGSYPPPEPSAVGAPLTPVMSHGTFVAPPKKDRASSSVSSLKITKIGLLSRKEDLAEGGKKAASRKWKGWSVVLTGSQLLFFKDPNWAGALQRVLDAAENSAAASGSRTDEHQVLVCSLSTPFKPDAVLSLADSAAIYDATYAKYSNVFRLVAPAGRQYLFQAHTAEDLNSWLHAINYAAAFKSANVRIRPLGPSKRAVDTAMIVPGPATELVDPPETLLRPRSPPLQPWRGLAFPSAEHTAASETSAPGSGQTDQDPSAQVVASQDDSLTPVLKSGPDVTPRPLSTFAPPLIPRPDVEILPTTLPSRADQLKIRIGEIEGLLKAAKAALQVDLRLARNFAVLTPFRSSTRERIVMALTGLEKRIRHARMHLAKLLCHREVLSRELLVEERDTRPSRKESQRRRVSGRRKRPSSPMRTPQASSQLWQNFSHPPSVQTDSELDSRDCYESAPEDLGPRHSITDDEDSLAQIRSPPMQRSLTDSAWTTGRFRSVSGASSSQQDELPPTRPTSMLSPAMSSGSLHPTSTIFAPSLGSLGSVPASADPDVELTASSQEEIIRGQHVGRYEG